jgi:mono/diheme cytochrome c family protein
MKYSIRQSILARVVRLAWLPLCLVLVACHVDMYDQPKYKPNDVSNFFPDGRAMQPPPANTVPLNSYNPSSPLMTGRVEGQLAEQLPPEIRLDAALLAHGQSRYNAFCAPCHGLVGDGQGVIAYRGPMTVPSLHQDRLRTVPIGYFFDVITNGIGRMYSYAARIPPEDRWAIAAYVRALQLSQNTDVALLSEAELERVKAGR